MRITYLQNPQVEIIKHDKVIGEGVQKTLAYDTPKTKEGLEAWRTEFWETRTSGAKDVWLLLQQACATSAENAAVMIAVGQLTLP